ncbi:unnamed protein product [Trichogramma brassicae]|uniref:Uncharacterized protein n=1 Tax=Trichogramma brassicae TaxID=86971 RepID=A0A6H5J6I8_9HYME|nr:unnamed protein product [Trichogramma brassicae]
MEQFAVGTSENDPNFAEFCTQVHKIGCRRSKDASQRVFGSLWWLFFLLGHYVLAATVCDLCECRYSRKNEDFGDQVYCSYQEQDILKTEHSLPMLFINPRSSSSLGFLIFFQNFSNII